MLINLQFATAGPPQGDVMKLDPQASQAGRASNIMLALVIGTNETAQKFRIYCAQL